MTKNKVKESVHSMCEFLKDNFRNNNIPFFEVNVELQQEIPVISVITEFKNQQDQIVLLITDMFKVSHFDYLDESTLAISFICEASINSKRSDKTHKLKCNIEVHTLLSYTQKIFAAQFPANSKMISAENLLLTKKLLNLADQNCALLLSGEKKDDNIHIAETDMAIEKSIDLVSVRYLLAQRVNDLKKTHFSYVENLNALNQVLRELKDFNLKSINEINCLITNDFINRVDEFIKRTNEIALLRDVMQYEDIDRYFKSAWKKRWRLMEKSHFNLLAKKWGAAKMDSVVSDNELTVIKDMDETDF